MGAAIRHKLPLARLRKRQADSHNEAIRNMCAAVRVEARTGEGAERADHAAHD
jgi:hypothetical protein